MSTRSGRNRSEYELPRIRWVMRNGAIIPAHWERPNENLQFPLFMPSLDTGPIGYFYKYLDLRDLLTVRKSIRAFSSTFEGFGKFSLLTWDDHRKMQSERDGWSDEQEEDWELEVLTFANVEEPRDFQTVWNRQCLYLDRMLVPSYYTDNNIADFRDNPIFERFVKGHDWKFIVDHLFTRMNQNSLIWSYNNPQLANFVLQILIEKEQISQEWYLFAVYHSLTDLRRAMEHDILIPNLIRPVMRRCSLHRYPGRTGEEGVANEYYGAVICASHKRTDKKENPTCVHNYRGSPISMFCNYCISPIDPNTMTWNGRDPPYVQQCCGCKDWYCLGCIRSTSRPWGISECNGNYIARSGSNQRCGNTVCDRCAERFEMDERDGVAIYTCSGCPECRENRSFRWREKNTIKYDWMRREPDGIYDWPHQAVNQAFPKFIEGRNLEAELEQLEQMDEPDGAIRPPSPTAPEAGDDY